MTDWTEENTNLDWIEKNKDSGAWEFTPTSPTIKKEGGNLIVDIWDIGRNDVIDVATVPPPDCSCKCEVEVEIVVVRTSIHDIKLDWTDNSSNETGFRVQRKISFRTFEEAGISPETKNLFIRTYSPDISVGTIPAEIITPKLTDLHLSAYRPTISIVPDWADYALLGANVTTFVDFGIDFNTRNVYSYRVYAYNGIGNSDYSNVVQTPSIPDTAHLVITTFAPTVG